MKAAYVDTSVLLTMAFDEKGAAGWRRKLATFDGIFTSLLAESEFAAALAREGVAADSRFLQPLGWLKPQRRLTAEVEQVLARRYLRGADLHHLAVACWFFGNPQDGTFLTADTDQKRAAVALGFRVWRIPD